MIEISNFAKLLINLFALKKTVAKFMPRFIFEMFYISPVRAIILLAKTPSVATRYAPNAKSANEP